LEGWDVKSLLKLKKKKKKKKGGKKKKYWPPQRTKYGWSW